VDFQKFNKIPRLSRDCVITEKIDGTNGQIFIIRFNDFWNLHEKHAGDSVDTFLKQYCLYSTLGIQDEDDILYMFAGSRNKWLDCSSKGDNMGFAKWVKENAESLLMLGEGRHYGEWYGKGIQRNYGLEEKRFTLFNVGKWVKLKDGECLEKESKLQECPKCCEVVPVIAECKFDTDKINGVLTYLKDEGSFLVPGFMNPEGIVIYHKASGQLFKKTIENDNNPKGI